MDWVLASVAILCGLGLFGALIFVLRGLNREVGGQIMAPGAKQLRITSRSDGERPPKIR